MVATDDPLFNEKQTTGVACFTPNSNVGTHATACTQYAYASAGGGDSTIYLTTTSIDPNNHVSVTYSDMLDGCAMLQYDSGTNAGTLTPNERKSIQYNALNEPTSVTVTDLAPQAGQIVTSVTTTVSYDDLGWGA